jgi:predicted ATPase
MRIAVSGTHCTGKSTLIDEFLRAHKDFAPEPEPYMVLVEDFSEEFSDEPRVDDFFRQLEFNANRLRQHARGESVIYERCPLDFLAYIDALNSESVEAAVDPVAEAIQFLELIVYVPLDDSIEVPDEEYPKLRKAVDRRLSAIFRENKFGLISSSGAVVVEATGSTVQRLRIVEDAMKSIDAS